MGILHEDSMSLRYANLNTTFIIVDVIKFQQLVFILPAFKSQHDFVVRPGLAIAKS